MGDMIGKAIVVALLTLAIIIMLAFAPEREPTPQQRGPVTTL